jgi:hypothetical protein
VHCPPELLEDLAPVLAEVRTWAGVVERSPGVFYVRRQPFLHFHLLRGARRCGDVKSRDGWMRFELPSPISTARRRSFLRELRKRYSEKAQ